MRILYGVQGTGNGHITRARMLGPALERHGAKIDYLFSGRDDAYFNMELFGEYRRLPGLTFIARKGKIEYLPTLRRNKLGGFFRDIKNLDLSGYDLVLNDFEPISAWAARRNGVPSLSLSHQNAFRYPIPVRGANPISKLVMKWFAPAERHIGLHWHHFGFPILPPMIETRLEILPPQRSKILVYLPFMQLTRYHSLFKQFSEIQFVQYHPLENSLEDSNIRCHPLSRSNFQQDFQDCSGLICSAGFGACSEALHYGKKLLTLPLHGQMEQLSNALALKSLGLATVAEAEINENILGDWLQQNAPPAMDYPDVAEALARWLVKGSQKSLESLSQELWNQTRMPGIDTISPRS